MNEQILTLVSRKCTHYELYSKSFILQKKEIEKYPNHTTTQQCSLYCIHFA